MHAGLLTSLGRLFRRNVRPLLLSSADRPASPIRQLAKRIYDLLGWLFVQLTLNYIVASFLLLHLAPSLAFFGRVGWYGDVLVALSFSFFKLGGPEKLARMLGMTVPAPVKREARSTKPALAAEEVARDATPSAAGLSTPTTTATEQTSVAAGEQRSRQPSIVVHPPTTTTTATAPEPSSAAPKPADLLAAAAPGTVTTNEEADWEMIGENNKVESS